MVKAATKEKHEALRYDLLQSAQDIVETESIEALTIRKLADSVGCATGMVYTIFADMDELVLQINALSLRILYDRLMRIDQKASDPLHALQQMGREYVDFCNQHQKLSSALFTYAFKENVRRPTWYQAEIDRLFTLIEGQLRHLFGDNPRKTSRAARVIWAGLYGITTLDHFGKLDAAGADSATALVDSLIIHYIDGLRYGS